jgi:uncharacterized membrane protein YeiH
MSSEAKLSQNRIIFIAQILSVSLIWVFVIGVGFWIANLISLSIELHDVPGASVGISIVAVPVFVILAGVLTYVFVGLQKKHLPSKKPEEK